MMERFRELHWLEYPARKQEYKPTCEDYELIKKDVDSMSATTLRKILLKTLDLYNEKRATIAEIADIIDAYDTNKLYKNGRKELANADDLISCITYAIQKAITND